MKIILASGSPRRRELMDLAGIDYEVMVSNVDETFEEGLSIDDQSKRLAYIKAKEIFDNTQGDRAIIGSDTMVVKGDKVYGKPQDRDEAIKMIKELEGTRHSVYTSLAILIEERGEYKEYIELSKVDVYFKRISDKEIQEYVDFEEPYDKAGAYAIQSSFCKFVEKIYGDYYSVVGLPIGKVYDILKENDYI